MKTIRILLVLLTSAWLMPQNLYADSAGSTGAAFLKLAMSARSAALGGQQAVPLGSESALFGNPAGLLTYEHIDFSCTYAAWLQSLYVGNLAVVFSGERFALGVGAAYLNYGDVPGFDVNANPTGNFGAHDLCAVAGASYKLIEGLQIGGNAKFLSSKIEAETATGFAADAGLLYRVATLPLSLGLVYQNVEIKKLSFVEEEIPLPAQMRGGAALTLLDRKLTVSAEALSDRDRGMYFSGGAEFRYFDAVALRAGYRTGPADVGSGLCLGGGLYWRQTGVDYAYEPFGELGDTHRFSLLIRLQ